MLVLPALYFIVAIGVVLAHDVGNAVVGKMLEGQLFPVAGNPIYNTIYYRRCMDYRRPMGLVLSEEAQNVVGIAAVHKAPHEVIFLGILMPSGH